jgi:hypothetical protein
MNSEASARVLVKVVVSSKGTVSDAKRFLMSWTGERDGVVSSIRLIYYTGYSYKMNRNQLIKHNPPNPI